MPPVSGRLFLDDVAFSTAMVIEFFPNLRRWGPAVEDCKNPWGASCKVVTEFL